MKSAHKRRQNENKKTIERAVRQKEVVSLLKQQYENEAAKTKRGKRHGTGCVCVGVFEWHFSAATAQTKRRPERQQGEKMTRRHKQLKIHRSLRLSRVRALYWRASENLVCRGETTHNERESERRKSKERGSREARASRGGGGKEEAAPRVLAQIHTPHHASSEFRGAREEEWSW